MCTEYYTEKSKRISGTWFIDTCSLLELEALKKLINNKSIFTSNGIKLMVIKSVYEELNKHQYSNNEFFSKDAKKALKIIETNKDIFTIEGVNESMRIDEAFADPEIIGTIIKKSVKKSQLVITQDKKLATDILNIKNSNSFICHKIFVCYLGEDGELYRNLGIEASDEITKTLDKDEIANASDHEISKTESVKPFIYVISGFAFGALVNEYKGQILNSINRLSRTLIGSTT